LVTCLTLKVHRIRSKKIIERLQEKATAIKVRKPTIMNEIGRKKERARERGRERERERQRERERERERASAKITYKSLQTKLTLTK